MFLTVLSTVGVVGYIMFYLLLIRVNRQGTMFAGR